MSEVGPIPEALWRLLVKGEFVRDGEDLQHRSDELARFVGEVPAEVSEVAMIIASLQASRSIVARSESGLLEKEYYLMNDPMIDRLFDHLVVALQCRLEALGERMRHQ